MTTKNIDFETLIKKLDSKIKTTASHIRDREFFPLIVKGCRLKPYSLFKRGKDATRLKFEPHWVDEFGNSLLAEKNSVRVVMNDVLLDKRTKISSDLFFGKSIDDTARDSQSVFILDGEYIKKSCLITFYGKDEYLRSFFFFEKWSRVSPLLLGMGTLRELYKNYSSIQRKEIDMNKCDSLIKFNVLTCIVGSQPTDWRKYIAGDLK
jgi:hypothetical protein